MELNGFNNQVNLRIEQKYEVKKNVFERDLEKKQIIKKMEVWNNLVLPNKLFVGWRNKIIDDKPGVRKKFKIWIR